METYRCEYTSGVCDCIESGDFLVDANSLDEALEKAKKQVAEDCYSTRNIRVFVRKASWFDWVFSGFVKNSKKRKGK